MNPDKSNPEIGRLSAVNYLRASGADVDSFLQGQLSSDLRLLSGSRAQISSYNSPKGRMLALPHLIRSGDDVLIEIHSSVAAATLKRLRMFVLRARVALEDASAGVQALALIGNSSAELLQQHGLPAPAAALESATDTASGLIVVRRIGALPRYSLIGHPDQLARLAFAASASADIDLAWRRADIEAGVAVVTAGTSDHFVPQMANLDLHGGISFDKGCYTGQEIVARLHYLGQLKRRMFFAHIAGPAPAPGSEVRIAGNGSAAGEIVDSVAEGTGSVANVVLQLAYAERNDLQLADGTSVVIAQHPTEAVA